MASPTAADLLVRIDATTEALRRELARGGAALGDFERHTKRSLTTIEGAFDGLRGSVGRLQALFRPLAATLGIVGFAQLGQEALRFADDIDDTSKRLGISAEQLQLFRAAALDTGVDTGVLEQAIKKFQVALGQAQNGSDTAIKKFKAIGVEFENGAGGALSFEQAMLNLADRVQSLSDPAAKAAAAAKLLGDRAGPELVPLLDQGAEGLRRFFEAARTGGQVMSDETVSRLGTAHDAIERFKNRIVIMTGEVLAALDKMAENTPDELAAQLELVNREITDLTENIAEAKAGDLNFTVGALGGLAQAEQRLNTILQRRADILSAQGRGGFGDQSTSTGKVTTTPFEIDLDSGGGGGGGAKSPAERAAERLQNTIDNVRAKIAQTTADINEDPLGKALAQNFDAAGASLDDFSPSLEELRALTELQVEADERLEIQRLALAAATEADKEAVQEYNATIEEGKNLTESLRTPQEAYNAALEKYNQLLRDGFINQETFNRAVHSAGEAFVQADESSQRLITSAGELTRGFVNAFGQMVSSGNTLKDVLNDLLGVLANVLANLAGGGIETLISNAIIGGLQAAATPGGGGSALGPVHRPLASGGFVRAGETVMVGERGPEPFTPMVPGMVLPSGSRMSGGININQSISINTNGGGTPQQNQDMMDKASRAFDRATRAVVEETIQLHMRDRGIFKPNVI